MLELVPVFVKGTIVILRNFSTVPVSDILGESACYIYWVANITTPFFSTAGRLGIAVFRLLLMKYQNCLVRGKLGIKGTLRLTAFLQITISGFLFILYREGKRPEQIMRMFLIAILQILFRDFAKEEIIQLGLLHWTTFSRDCSGKRS